MIPADGRQRIADLSDAELVRAARGGDRRAYALLVERYWPLLYSLCRRALGDPWLADDAAQEAVLQAMLSLGSLRRPEAFSSWLAGIGLNVCRRLLRAAWTQPALSWGALLGGVSGPVWDVVDFSPSPAEVVEAAELGERVRAAVDCLPAGQRSAVLLFYLSGLTHREVAIALGIEVGAVKTRLNKARRALRKSLESVWQDAGARWASTHGGAREGEKMAKEGATLVSMRVADIRRVPAEGGAPTMHVVVLEEIGGERRLLIWIGEWETVALAMQLTGQQPPRPMTYTFVAALLGEVGASVRRVAVSRFTETVFYASVEVVAPDGRTSEVDARPSDALNLALVAGAPIFVDQTVLAAVGSPPAVAPEPKRDRLVMADPPTAAPPSSRTSHPFGPGTIGASEILAEATADWPKPPSL